MSSPLQFGGPVALPADPTTNLGPATKQYADARINTSWLLTLSSAGGFAEFIRMGSLNSSVSFLTATSFTSTSARTFTALFPVSFDSNMPGTSVTGVQMWVTTAPTAATQSGTYAVYTGATFNDFVSNMVRVGTASAVSFPTVTTGLKRMAFASPVSTSGIYWMGVQMVLGAPASGAGAAFSASAAPSSALPAQGGKYGEFTTATTAPPTTLSMNTAASSITVGQSVWMALY